MKTPIQLKGPFAANEQIILGEKISHLAISAPFNHKFKINNEKQEFIMNKFNILDYEVDSITSLSFVQDEDSKTIITYILEKEDENETNI